MVSKTINNATKEVKKLVNEVRSNLSREEINKVRKKLLRIEVVYNILKEEEQKGSLTSRQENMLRDDETYLKKISKHLKNLKKHFKKYQHGIDYLFDEHSEEDYTSNNDSNAFNEVRKLFNERRSNLLLKETKRIRKKLYKKEAVYNFLKDKKQEGSSANKQKNVLKSIDRYLKKLNSDLKKLQKYEYNLTYGLDYLLNEVNEEDYYKPTEVKSAFDGSYVLYESKEDKDNVLAIYEYFDKIKPYLKDMIEDYKSKGEWKIQITMRISIISFIDKNETQVMHTKSDNIKVMSGTDTSDAINELINSFTKRYQEGLETKMKGSSYIFECVDFLEYHLHKISLNRGSLYIDPPTWLKNKRVIINPKNTKNNNCFQYTITAALNY